MIGTQRVIHVNDMKPGDTYIGRAVPRKKLKRSPFANPFQITPERTRLECVMAFEIWVRTSNDPDAVYVRTRLDDLQGDLGCWCRDKKHPNRPCHGTVLLKLKEEAGL